MAVPYLTAQQVRDAVTGLEDETKYPDATLQRFISRYEDMAERYRGVAFTPRTETRTFTAASGPILSPHPRVSAVSAVAYDEGTAPDPADVLITDGFILSIRPGWPVGRRVTLTYTHGYPEPPAAVIDGCIEFVRAEARQQKDSQPRNVTGVRDDLGWSYESTADWDAGRPTKWLVVNEALNSVPDERIPGMA